MGCRPFDLHRCVAPSRAACAAEATRPLVSDVHTSCNAHAFVDDEQLAMIARYDAEPRTETNRIEDCQLNACAAQSPKERSRCLSATDPVDEQAYFDTSIHCGDERFGDTPANLVGAENVALEGDALARALDEIDHCVERGGTIAQQRNVIAARHVGRGDTPQAECERLTRGG